MKQFLYIMTVFVLASCGSKKAVNTTETVDVGSKRLIKEYYANTLEFKTLDARTRVRYEDKKRTQTVTLNIRMEKDKKIWLSASLLGITGARALVTPERVQFYDKLNRQYFDGDFEFLSQYLGVAINFAQLQRLLVGQTVYDLREGDYTFEDNGVGYTVTPKKQLPGIDLLFAIDSKRFVTDKQRVSQPTDNVSLDVDYRDFEMVGGKPYPTTMSFLANDRGSQKLVQIEFRDIDLDGEVRFPFSIPSGYKEMKLDAK